MNRLRWALPAAALLLAAAALAVLYQPPEATAPPSVEVLPAPEAVRTPTPPPPSGPVPAPSGTVRYVTPGGAGLRDGSSWESAGALADLPDLVEASAPGDEVWLDGGDGPYEVVEPIVLRAGGAEGAPVTVRGVEGTPLLTGERANPFTPGEEEGEEAFRLLEGADHLHFVNLSFADVGNGCFRIGADVTGLEISDVQAANVVRFVENTASGDGDSASVRGLVLRRVRVDGYAKGVVRLRYDSSEVLLEDVEGSGTQGTGEEYPMGVHLDDSAHAVTLRRVTMRDSVSREAEDEYWNGDGFAAERGTYDLRFEDTLAAGNSDAGYDLKSSSTQLVRPVAEGNGRNYRLWGAGIEVSDCEGRAPRRLGGTTTQAQVQSNDGADAVLRGCRFLDADPATIVFDADGDGAVLVEGGQVSHAAEGRLETVEEDATLELVGVATESR